MTMGKLVAAMTVLLCGLGRAAAVVDNAIVDWNNAALDTARNNYLPAQIAMRYYALTSLAQWKALQENGASGANADPRAVAALAGHYILSNYFPENQAAYDSLLQRELASWGLTPAQVQAALQVAVPVAVEVAANRLADGSESYAPFIPAPANGPAGQYQFVPGQTAADYPQLATTTPFVIQNVTTFAIPPPAINSSEYFQGWNTTFLEGRATGSNRTQDQTDTAFFWDNGNGTAGIGGAWFRIAQLVLAANSTLNDTATLFAKLAAAQYDSNIAGWWEKFNYGYWRPVTAIRQCIPGSNLPADPAWTPLLDTPDSPEYPSTHAVTAGASAAVLSDYFGTNNVPFTITSEYPGLPTRSYPSFSAAAQDVAQSKWAVIYGGVHFPDSFSGIPLGQAVSTLGKF
ncbi:hypothetical protein WJX72_004370 [[Myrmecia] bisecta]|uniref:Phosphatidic acid phosphatase type 2/haloperoxidase domain-containing protein n=1 Tax=[Myrmecia] bisecta TaxID=41462 RepID=A0AAW1Q2H3_9CHLO